MKRWKYSVFIVFVMVFGVIGADFLRIPGTVYAKEKASENYEFTSKDTIEIYTDNLYYDTEEVKQQFETVKNIRLMCDNIYFGKLKEFPNAETLYIAKNMTLFTGMEYQDDVLPKLKKITVENGNTAYESFDGALYTKSLYTLLRYPADGEKKVVIPAKTQVIADRAFYQTGITSVAISEGLRVIGERAFANTKLQEISLPASFRTIQKGAFLNTPLTKVTIAKNNASLTDVDGVLYSKDKTILYYWPEQKVVEDLILPDELRYLNCTMIPTFDQVKTITLPKNLEAISNTELNKIERVVLPKENLNFHMYDGVLYSPNEKIISLYPNGNPDTDIVMSSSLERFPMELFYKENTTKTLTLPKGLTELEGTRKWGKVLLNGFCNLSELKFDGENSNFILKDGVLYNKEKTALLWYPANLEKKSFIIPDTVTIIENDQFVRQNYLEKLTISAKCKIYDYLPLNSDYSYYYEMPVGKYCPCLAEFAVAKDNELYTVQHGVLYSKDMTVLYGYPSAKKDKSYQIPDGVVVAPFGNTNPYLETLTIPKSLISIAAAQEWESYWDNEEGLLLYGALKEIKVASDHTVFTAREGVLYKKLDSRIEMFIYPQGKTDESFNLPADMNDILNFAYLEKSPYLKRLYVDKNSKYNSIKDGKLCLNDCEYPGEYSFEKIELIEK